MNEPKKRCFGTGNPLYEYYHDHEWGIPSHDDQYLFEMLCLEGAQAGLSWETILKRRNGYKEAFHNFDPHICKNMTDEELEALRENPKIIRNRLKIYSVRSNARVFCDIQKECGSFNTYLWAYVDNTPIQNVWKTSKDVPATSAISDALSKDLKKRGMSFVGSTILYAYMQAVGMVNDHPQSCPSFATNR